jgi:hypothetical protein
MRGWCGIKHGPNWAKVGLAGPTSMADRPGVGSISISALPTCQGGLVHRIYDAQSQWRLSWVASRPRVQSVGQGLVSYRLKLTVELTHSSYKYPHIPLCVREIRKWGLASYSGPKFILCRVERQVRFWGRRTSQLVGCPPSSLSMEALPESVRVRWCFMSYSSIECRSSARNSANSNIELTLESLWCIGVPTC